jgi:dTDP-4-dehydrorhamnose reductase
MIKKSILILGASGKMGIALSNVLASHFTLILKNSAHFDANNKTDVALLLQQTKPDYVINCVALLGIDYCEQNPNNALSLNSLYPKQLAELSNQLNFTLIHFSTESVFPNRTEGFYSENDNAQPINTYGITKYAGDCFIQAIAKHYYIIRIGMLFGPAKPDSAQFLEKMIGLAKQGKDLSISTDVFTSATYSMDVAECIQKMIDNKAEYGLYHVVNDGVVSLYELVQTTFELCQIKTKLTPVSHDFFKTVGLKNTYTAMKSAKGIQLPPWKTALEKYVSTFVF